MSQNAMKRLYLMQVGSMPEYQIPIVCYLVQTGDGKNILIDSGLPEMMPEGEAEFENGQDVTGQLASIGLNPDDTDTVISTHYDIDHAGRHAAFTKAHYVVQRVHHVDAASNPRFAANRPQWDQPMERMRLVDGDTELLPGLALIETSGHVPGHQSVLVRQSSIKSPPFWAAAPAPIDVPAHARSSQSAPAPAAVPCPRPPAECARLADPIGVEWQPNVGCSPHPHDAHAEQHSAPS